MAMSNQEPQNPHHKVWLEQALARRKEGEMLVGDSSLRSLVRGQVQAAKLLGLLQVGLLSTAPPPPPHPLPLLLAFLLVVGFASIPV